MSNGTTVNLEVHWPKPQREHANEDHSEPSRKRRRVIESNVAGELAAISSWIRPDMDKYIAEVTRQCKAMAHKGHSHADVFVDDCHSTPEDVKHEVELLGITVDKCYQMMN